MYDIFNYIHLTLNCSIYCGATTTIKTVQIHILNSGQLSLFCHRPGIQPMDMAQGRRWITSGAFSNSSSNTIL